MKKYVVVYKQEEYMVEEKIEVLANSSFKAYEKVQNMFNWTLWGAYVEYYIKKDNTKHYFKNIYGKPY